MTAARTYLAGIKERAEKLDYVREHGSSDALHATAAADLKALTAAIDAVLALADTWEEEFPYKAWRVRAAIENALKESQ